MSCDCVTFIHCPKGQINDIIDPRLHAHNKMQDLTAYLMSEVCHDVCVEPTLQSLTSEHLSFATANREDSACLDVRASGFWGLSQQSAFFGVQVFNPCAPSWRGSQMADCYKRREVTSIRAACPCGGAGLLHLSCIQHIGKDG